MQTDGYRFTYLKIRSLEPKYNLSILEKVYPPDAPKTVLNDKINRKSNAYEFLLLLHSQ